MHHRTSYQVIVVAAYLGLFVWSFLAATVFPGGSEVALVVLVRTQHHVALPVLVATLGNYGGACTTYWLGRRAAKVLAHRAPVPAPSPRAAWLFQRYGAPALALSWVPVVGDALVALAGAGNIPFGRFSVWVVLGKVVRYLVVAWAALLVG